MSALDAPTAALVRAAALFNQAEPADLSAAFVTARAAGAPPEWLDELLLLSVLFVGFPRALVAAGALRRTEPLSGPVGDADRYNQWPEWQKRGEETCRRVYGASYESLRRNVAELHPAFDAWMVMDGYGRTLSRTALDLPRRELCIIAILAGQNAPRQLRSHLRGALNTGASAAQVDEALAIALEAGGVGQERAAAAREQWSSLRP